MQTTITPTILDYALNYAAQFGWAVFPCHSVTDDGFCTCGKADCKSEGKHPQTAKGSLDASRDEADITAWFAGSVGGHNIGIATGGVSQLIVVDVDQGKGADINDLLIAGLDQTVFNTAKVKTGAGLHFYYHLPAGVTIKNSASRLGKYIDVRGDGGYVIAPPSKHVSGKNYELLNPNTDGSVDILDFPQAWLDKLGQPLPATNGNSNGSNGNGSSPFVIPAAQPGVILPDSINQGQRNVEITKIAGALRSKGLSEGAIFAALDIENQRICKPPLDTKELHQIAHSVGRYKPQDVLNQVSDADPNAPAGTDYENTLVPYLFGDFLDVDFEEKEILSFHIGKRDIAIIQAATNAGKTTLLRNVTLCMGAGRPFMPFYEGNRPIKIAYFDFESDAQDVQRDLREMFSVFTASEAKLLRDNLIIIPKGLMDGELFQFNRHEAWANSLIVQNNIEFIIVDNVSAAYDINDENSNAEVTKKIIKPLLKMAYKGNCAFLFAHHYGKGKTELEHAGVHAGRGASALQALSRTVINMFGDVSKGEPVNVECAKRKTDGGQNYSETFRLEADRWFHHTTIVPPPKKQTAYKTIRRFMENVAYPDMKTMGELILEFEDQFSEIAIKKAVSELYKDGFLDKPKHGAYCNKPGTNPTTTTPPAAKSFYEKDDD
jgi:hypothetical protein